MRSEQVTTGVRKYTTSSRRILSWNAMFILVLGQTAAAKVLRSHDSHPCVYGFTVLIVRRVLSNAEFCLAAASMNKLSHWGVIPPMSTEFCSFIRLVIILDENHWSHMCRSSFWLTTMQLPKFSLLNLSRAKNGPLLSLNQLSDFIHQKLDRASERKNAHFILSFCQASMWPVWQGLQPVNP